MTKRRNINTGFTLVEIMIVLTIIAALAIISIAIYQVQIRKANDATRKSDLTRIQIAIEEYEKDHNCYPAPELVNCNPGTGLQPYLNKIPCDPVTGASYYYDFDVKTVCASWYRLYATLYDGSGSSYGPGKAFNYYASSPNAPNPVLIQVNGFYGCKGGFCVSVLWNSSINAPECTPSFRTANCNNQCGIGSTQCKSQ